MRKLLLGIMLLCAMFFVSCTVHAHPPVRVIHHDGHTHSHAVNSYRWVYVDGYWSRGVWVEAKWVKRPVVRAHHRHRWVRGHYRGHGPHRRWVPGRWSHR